VAAFGLVQRSPGFAGLLAAQTIQPIRWRDSDHRVDLERSAGDRQRHSGRVAAVRAGGPAAAMAMYAGCGVADIADVPTAAQIVERMMAEAVPLLPLPARWGRTRTRTTISPALAP